ncbi:MAG: hypothetical protein DRP45_11415 [Candidatus Zixiibacteriota bacterium]|nr:MAG: hypothetical protein DRP45_11415 [candidate division Zixibacteria bacterium]
MREKIGATAGKIWDTLNDGERVSVSRLPKMVEEKDVIVYQSLGWLAREGKVEYHRKGNGTAVSLVK